MREYIDKIINDNGDMQALEDIMCDALDMLDEEDKDEIMDKLYVLAYGEGLSEEKAEELVAAMPLGEHWSLSQTNSANTNFNNYSRASFYYTMNMLYNDYVDVLGSDANLYVKLANAFLNDVDSPQGDAKVYRYVKAMK